ncbi:MAG: S8 family serine peptidase, partial [Thermoanaerobaculia bacterium]
YVEYYSEGQRQRLRLETISDGERRTERLRPAAFQEPVKPQEAGSAIFETLSSQQQRVSSRFQCLSRSEIYFSPSRVRAGVVIPTETVAVDGARSSEIRWMRSEYGMKPVAEGRCGKVLLIAPEDCENRVAMAFEAADALFRRGNVGASHPNFLRVLQRPGPSAHTAETQWALDNPGEPGLIGADVHALAAWTVTTGSAGVRVAVLDEGVDTDHRYLEDAVVAEADFVDGNQSARPDGNDAHGTACAGIVVGQSDRAKGLAPGVRLVAARIAKSDDRGFWVFDDFETADAIDWAWEKAKSDVLSNSWGGGPPADVIANAFGRARTQGRGGKGAVVVVAAGNSQSQVDFPGNLEGVLTVGASNQWDERKTRSSKDGESWWGSNYGDELDLLAPGVRITTTDIWGPRGYSTKAVTSTFNGTSAAAPHVAAAAGLMLSAKPELTEDRVRAIIKQTADALSQGDQPRLVGSGRLNAYMAVRVARRG